MATRVIAAQDKTSSGAGDDVQIKAGNANTSGAGGSIIIQPGAQATTGGNGLLIVRQPSGVAGTDEIQLSHDGGKGSVINKDGVLQLGGSHIALRTTANNAKTNLTAGTIYCDGLYSSNIINADGQTNDSYSWAIDGNGPNWNQGFNLRVGWSHIKGYANFGLAYTGDNTNGKKATLELTDGSTGGGAWAYRSSTTTVNTSYNDLNLAGHSAFQRLNATAATTITGIAPASTAGGSGFPTWIHTDGRIFWLYNVGTFNITLANESASSTAGNRVTTQTGANVILGPGRMMQIVYDGTSSRWRTSGETYPYVFPTTDGTNGQVLTTNGSGTLSWTTPTGGVTGTGTTGNFTKFTGTNTVGNSAATESTNGEGFNIFTYGGQVNVGSSVSGAGNFTNSLIVTNATKGNAIEITKTIADGNNAAISASSAGGYIGAFYSAATTTKGLMVRGASGQTANLQEWQDNTGAVVAAVSPTGAFTGSSFTPYGTFNSTTTIFGNNYWTPNYTGGVTSPSAGTYTKSTGNANVWNGQVYSSEGYTKNVYCAARASQTNGNIMFGLNNDPATDGNYTSLDYVWYFLDNATLMIFENGVQVASYGAYTTSTVLSITYDGSNVQYWKDGVIQRTVARSTGNPLYFDTSFYTLSSSLNSVQFGPIGQPFGISGTSGYLPKFTSQQTLGNSIVYDNGTNVGIGTASPSFKLQVDAGSVDANIVANVTSGYGGIGVYAAGTSKVILGYVGANTNYGSQTVAGDVSLKLNGTNLHIVPGAGNAATTAYFSSAGNMGVGSISPGARLQVDTGATGTKGQIIKAVASQTANLLEVQNSAGTVLTNIDSGGNLTVATTTSAYITFSSSTTPRWKLYHNSANGYFALFDNVWDGVDRIQVTPGGNVVLGNAGGDQNNGPKLLVTTGPDTTGNTGAARKGVIVRGSASQTANLQEWQDNAGTALAYISSNGSVIGTPSVCSIGANDNTGGQIKLYGAAQGYGVGIRQTSLDGDVVRFQTGQVSITAGQGGNNAALLVTGNTGPSGSVATFTNSGDVASKVIIAKGKASQTGNLQEWQNSSGTALAYMDANGNFFAVSKSFLIPHPTPAKAAEGKKLRYASLEGPENGVYYRGRLEGESEIVLPDYWKDLVDPESITVNLTARKFAQPSLFVVDANVEKVIVESDREINCDFVVFATRRDIAKLEVEPDGE